MDVRPPRSQTSLPARLRRRMVPGVLVNGIRRAPDTHQRLPRRTFDRPRRTVSRRPDHSDHTRQALTTSGASALNRSRDTRRRRSSGGRSRTSRELARSHHERHSGVRSGLQPDALPPDQKDAVGHLLKSGDHVRELINEMLDMSRRPGHDHVRPVHDQERAVPKSTHGPVLVSPPVGSAQCEGQWLFHGRSGWWYPKSWSNEQDPKCL